MGLTRSTIGFALVSSNHYDLFISISTALVGFINKCFGSHQYYCFLEIQMSSSSFCSRYLEGMIFCRDLRCS